MNGIESVIGNAYVMPNNGKNNKFKPDLTKSAKGKNNGNQKKTIIRMLHRIRKELNPSPMLPIAYMLNWDEKEKAVVIDIADNKTGRVIGTVPPSQVLKYLKDYHKGMFYDGKSKNMGM